MKYSARLTAKLIGSGKIVSDTIIIEADSPESAEQALAVALRRLAACISDQPPPGRSNSWCKAKPRSAGG